MILKTSNPTPIKPGKHGVIIGKNGSGKSQMLICLARLNHQRVVILDTKLDDDFMFLAEGDEVLQCAESYQETVDLLNAANFEYLIIRPKANELSVPEALDNYLKLLSKCKNLTIFIDEGYQFHNNGRAGSGYVSILTRGRSRGLSLVVCTQRPLWLSTFSFSESSYFYIYDLMLDNDIKKIREFIPFPNEALNLNEFYYYFYCTFEKRGIICKPIQRFKRSIEHKVSLFKILFKRS